MPFLKPTVLISKVGQVLGALSVFSTLDCSVQCSVQILSGIAYFLIKGSQTKWRFFISLNSCLSVIIFGCIFLEDTKEKQKQSKNKQTNKQKNKQEKHQTPHILLYMVGRMSATLGYEFQNKALVRVKCKLKMFLLANTFLYRMKNIVMFKVH